MWYYLGVRRTGIVQPFVARHGYSDETAEPGLQIDSVRSHFYGGNFMKFSTVVLKNFLNDESGQDLIEYALVAGLIGLATVAAMSTLAGNISSAFNAVGSQLTSAV
jgi:pilus assembly protein Flp/PilA